MQEERKRILNLVKEGKLTVNEALVLLEGLDDSEESMKKKKEALFGELSTTVHFEEAKKEDSYSQQKFQSTKEKLFEFVDTALKKIKDFDLDLNFGASIDISHIFQQSDVYLKEMDVDLANGSVKIVPWDQQDVRVECEAKVYRVDTQDEARNHFLKNVTFAIEGQKLRFHSQQKWMKIHAILYIPQAQYDNIKVRMFNGPIESENLHVEKYNVKTANGKINIFGITSKYLDAETANGQIEVRDGKVEDFEAETINGAIKLDGSFERLELQSFNGNIICSLTDPRCDRIEAKGTTGAIKLYLPREMAISGEAKSNVGSFDIDYSGIQVVDEKNEVIQKLVRFQPTIPSERTARIYLDSKTGSIAIKRNQ
ncbi:DUF4097 family beta strand repeat-containing protein [Robertmurraya andreesenii]|uniref:DUF4097 and DUF4098 domain-containing protein YvlB n=1 Tax=Anoxybacillus andreesenii TaxID=1325932 RepID=A0ABT9V7V8_9BACL|nr:DUF4097 domain-containing protein [Robertmurraya andreesenii]MDQ0157044.1 DUF4097 and DUF4098 domain-containing protein YvlB [Robertmurraya andreesenii]